MLIRGVLSAVCVACLAPGMSVGAQSAGFAGATDKTPVASDRAVTGATTGVDVQDGVKDDRAAQAGVPPVFTLQIPEQPKPPEARIVLEAPTVTCPMIIVPVGPGIDPKLVAPTPKGKKFTIRSVAPPMCR